MRARPPRWWRTAGRPGAGARWSPRAPFLAALAVMLGLSTLAHAVTEGEWLGCLAPQRTASQATGAHLATADGRRTPLLLTRAGSSMRVGYEQRTITVAVIDGGVDPAHADVGRRRTAGIDLVDPCGRAEHDPTGHGTTVAAVLSSTLDAHEAFVPGAHVQIMPVRTSTARGEQPRWSTAIGILLAVHRGADVLNLSMSSQSRSPSAPEALAVRYALRRGVVVVAAAGNRPTDAARYPAAYPGVISVTATSSSGRLASWATTRGSVDVAARGVHRWVGGDRRTDRTLVGTSWAAPIVSAAAALLKAQDPSLTPAQVERLLETTAAPVTDAYGAPVAVVGEVSVGGALRRLAGADVLLTGS